MGHDLKVNLWKTKVLVSGGITKGGISEGKISLCRVCSLIVEANTVLCVQCGLSIHGRCAGVKIVIP